MSESPLKHQYQPLREPPKDLSWSEICAGDPLVGDHWKTVESETDSLSDWDIDSDNEEALQLSKRQSILGYSKDASTDKFTAWINSQYWTHPLTSSDVIFDLKSPETLIPAINAYKSKELDHFYQPLANTSYFHEHELIWECIQVLHGNFGPIFSLDNLNSSFKVI